MSNRYFNKQVVPPQDGGKSEKRPGQKKTDSNPACKQVTKEPIGMPTMSDQGSKSKSDMIDQIL